MKYVVKFIPDNTWGCIVETVDNKEDAYRIYHEMKIEVDIRPGHLFILEINNEGEEKYLCNYRTGKDKNGLEIVKEIKGLLEQLMNLYDIENLKTKKDEYNRLSTDILHGIELIDFTKVDEEQMTKRIFQQQKVMSNARRQYKYLLKDANDIKDNLKYMFDNVNAIERALKKNENYRNNENTKEKTKYLKKIGINTDEYFKN